MLSARTTTSIVRTIAVCTVIGALLGLVATSVEGESDAVIPIVARAKWNVVLKGKTQSPGEFTMIFKPAGEDPKEFTIRVTAKMQAKKIAQDVAKELTLVAGERFKIKQNGNQVMIKSASKKDPACSLRIKQQNLSGVSILIQGK
jgi:hypothetical protein